jgi:hypothetical protein
MRPFEAVSDAVSGAPLADVPERRPNYLYLSLVIIVPILTASVGVLLSIVGAAPWWIALPVGNA